MSVFGIPKFQKFEIPTFLKFQNFKFNKLTRLKPTKLKTNAEKYIAGIQTVMYTDLPTFSEFQILRYENNISQGCAHKFIVFFEVINTGIEGPSSVYLLEVPEIIQKVLQ